MPPVGFCLAISSSAAGKFQEALDRLVQATSASPEDARLYATLSLLYTKIGECSLAWKYFQIAEDLGYRSSDLERGVKALCKKAKEERHEEILKVDRSERGTFVTIQFSPEQQRWPSRARLPIFHPLKIRRIAS